MPGHRTKSYPGSITKRKRGRPGQDPEARRRGIAALASEVERREWWYRDNGDMAPNAKRGRAANPEKRPRTRAIKDVARRHHLRPGTLRNQLTELKRPADAMAAAPSLDRFADMVPGDTEARAAYAAALVDGGMWGSRAIQIATTIDLTTVPN